MRRIELKDTEIERLRDDLHSKAFYLQRILEPPKLKKLRALFKDPNRHAAEVREAVNELLSEAEISALMDRWEPPPVASIEAPSHLPHEFWARANLFQLIYSLAGLVLGLVCIIGGLILFLRGVTGSTSWTAKIVGAESTITDAAPGAVLFIVGLFIVFVTRYIVKVKHR